MPQLTVANPKGQEGTGQEGRGDRDRARRWMEDGEREPPGRPEPRPNQRAAVQPQQTSQRPRPPRPAQPWQGFIAVGAVWWVCMAEAPLHPSPVDVCWRLLLLCSLWLLVGGCVHALRRRLWLRQNLGERPVRMQQDVVTEDGNYECSWSQLRDPGHGVPLTHALADGLLLCVLQEPLSDPSMPHIQTLFSRLESVSHTLAKADVGSGASPQDSDRDSILTDKVTLIRSYLQRRMRSLRRLLQVQGDFVDSVKDLLAGLDGLWAQLEALHTGVTLTKEGNRGPKDLASAQAGAKTLFTVLGHSKNRLQCCHSHLKDSTQLLQELTWSHTHTSSSVSSSMESVWPELLLQSNIEQFDKVQEGFLSLEQQTSTFRTHLEGLGKGTREGRAGPLAHANRAQSRPLPSTTSPQRTDK